MSSQQKQQEEDGIDSTSKIDPGRQQQISIWHFGKWFWFLIPLICIIWTWAICYSFNQPRFWKAMGTGDGTQYLPANVKTPAVFLRTAHSSSPVHYKQGVFTAIQDSLLLVEWSFEIPLDPNNLQLATVQTWLQKPTDITWYGLNQILPSTGLEIDPPIKEWPETQFLNTTVLVPCRKNDQFSIFLFTPLSQILPSTTTRISIRSI